jgi:prenylcysteine oxidase/farnesylcysteine lyase
LAIPAWVSGFVPSSELSTIADGPQNGTAFLYQTSLSHSIFSGWWDTLSAAYRYGPLSPIRTNSAVNALVKRFSMLYNFKIMSERGAVRSVRAMADHLGLGAEMTKRKADDWALKGVGVGEKWMGEVMEGTTRNVVSSGFGIGHKERLADRQYGMDMSSIHALAAGVSMATSGASSIEGGNWRVFEGMLKNASATLVLGTTVSHCINSADSR